MTWGRYASPTRARVTLLYYAHGNSSRGSIKAEGRSLDLPGRRRSGGRGSCVVDVRLMGAAVVLCRSALSASTSRYCRPPPPCIFEACISAASLCSQPHWQNAAESLSFKYPGSRDLIFENNFQEFTTKHRFLHTRISSWENPVLLCHFIQAIHHTICQIRLSTACNIVHYQ